MLWVWFVGFSYHDLYVYIQHSVVRLKAMLTDHCSQPSSTTVHSRVGRRSYRVWKHLIRLVF